MNEWKEGLTREELYNAMMELFYRDLETWFTAASFYCDSCVDDFIELWPGIYNRDLDFQRNSISLDTFFSGGRVQDFFTEEEFFDLAKDITCPNCGDCLSGNIWPYDLRFEVPNGFETDILEIANLAEKTPFLVMLHPFSMEVYEEIKTIFNNTPSSLIPNPLYRARLHDKKKQYNKNDFFAPPKKVITEGRYNHAGRQVLYLAEDDFTCYLEMREPADGIVLSQLNIQGSIKILDLMAEDLEENPIIQAMQFSSLLSSPNKGEGWYKPHYVFTRFVADVALSAGFDAIRYPSVRSDTGNNIAILNYENFKEKIHVITFNYVSEQDFLTKRKLLKGY